MSGRFDAEKDKFVNGPHSYDRAERDGWAGDEETLFYLTDGQSNGRWLYVEHPGGDGEIPVGIARVYEKHLSPKAARAVAAALLAAADESDAGKPERDAREKARLVAQSLLVQTAAAGGRVDIAWGPR
jgi:hypothetical protein